jgi:citrate synthase
MGFKPDIFTVLFAIPRMTGWLAQWRELITDKEQKIARPRQLYLGYERREFVPLAQRGAAAAAGAGR